MEQAQPAAMVRRGSLKSFHISLPTAETPVVECPRAKEPLCAQEPLGFEAPTDAQSAQFWSTHAMVSFDMSASLERESDCDEGGTVLQEDSQLRPRCGELDLGARGSSYGIVLFLPDLREPQDPADAGAGAASSLFEVLAHRIAECPHVDCYQLEWPSMREGEDAHDAVGEVLQTLQMALGKATPESHPDRLWDFRVFLIGERFGGAIAAQAASELSQLFHQRDCALRVEGLCTIDTHTAHQEDLDLGCLQNCRTLLIDGQRSEGAAHEATRNLFAALPATRKEMLVLPQAEDARDPCDNVGLLLPRLVEFVLRGLM